MAKRRKTVQTLEEQFAAIPAYPLANGPYDAELDGPLGTKRIAWHDNRRDLTDRINARNRKAARIKDPGADASGKFGVSPYAARGQIVETAPKELRSNGESQFPKRISTQRVIDRYRVRGHISEEEWLAADAVWQTWNGALLEAKVTSGYEPVSTGGTGSQDHKIARRVDSARFFVWLMSQVPYRSQGVVRAVVVEDWTASDWAHLRGFRNRDSERHGLKRLRSGLQALVHALGY